METYFTKIKKWGSSLAIIIDNLYVKENKLSKGDLIEVKISKISREKEIKSYRCRKCSHLFDTDEDIPYCPICNDDTRVEEIR